MIIKKISNDRKSVVRLDNNCSVAPLGVGNADIVLLGTGELVEKPILVLIVAHVEIITVGLVDVILVVDPGNCIGVSI